MSARADLRSVSRQGRAAKGGRAIGAALAFIALVASGSHAFARIIPIQATLTGAGEAPPNNSPAKGLMEGTFDTDTNTLTWRSPIQASPARQSAPISAGRFPISG